VVNSHEFALGKGFGELDQFASREPTQGTTIASIPRIGWAMMRSFRRRQS